MLKAPARLEPQTIASEHTALPLHYHYTLPLYTATTLPLHYHYRNHVIIVNHITLYLFPYHGYET